MPGASVMNCCYSKLLSFAESTLDPLNPPAAAPLGGESQDGSIHDMHKLILLCTVIFGPIFTLDYCEFNKFSRTTPSTACLILILQRSFLSESVEEITDNPYEQNAD